MKQTGFILILLIVSFCISCKHSPEKYKRPPDKFIKTSASGYRFYLNLKTGTKYYYTIENEAEINIDVNGSKNKAVTMSTIGLFYQVLPDSANQFIVKITYDKLDFKTDKNGAKQEMSSENKGADNDITNELLVKLKGQSVYLTLDKKGILLSLRGEQEIMNYALASLNIKNEAQKDAIEKQLSSLLGDHILQDNVANDLNLFPDSAIYIGDTWTKKGLDHSQFNLRAINHFMFSDADDSSARIEGETELSSDNSHSQLMGLNVVMNLSGKDNSSYTFNVNSGMMIKQESKTNIEGSVQTNGRDVPVQMTIKKEASLKQL